MSDSHNVIYRNRLPHITPAGARFFVTFRLADALPRVVIKQLESQKAGEISLLEKQNLADFESQIMVLNEKYFGKYEHQVDSLPYGNCFLRKKEIAEIVIAQLERFDGEWYDLYAFCIMPNHVHILIDTYKQLNCLPQSDPGKEVRYAHLDWIMQHIKGTSARHANLSLKRSGTFWQKESYDRYIRDLDEWNRTIEYIANNPVKAGLVTDWQAWPWTYVK